MALERVLEVLNDALQNKEYWVEAYRADNDKLKAQVSELENENMRLRIALEEKNDAKNDG